MGRKLTARSSSSSSIWTACWSTVSRSAPGSPPRRCERPGSKSPRRTSATASSASPRRLCSASSRPSTAAACRTPSRRPCGHGSCRPSSTGSSQFPASPPCSTRSPWTVASLPAVTPSGSGARSSWPACSSDSAAPVQCDHGQRRQAGAGSVPAGGGDNGGRAGPLPGDRGQRGRDPRGKGRRHDRVRVHRREPRASRRTRPGSRRPARRSSSLRCRLSSNSWAGLIDVARCRAGPVQSGQPVHQVAGRRIQLAEDGVLRP